MKSDINKIMKKYDIQPEQVAFKPPARQDQNIKYDNKTRYLISKCGISYDKQYRPGDMIELTEEEYQSIANVHEYLTKIE